MHLHFIYVLLLQLDLFFFLINYLFKFLFLFFLFYFLFFIFFYSHLIFLLLKRIIYLLFNCTTITISILFFLILLFFFVNIYVQKKLKKKHLLDFLNSLIIQLKLIFLFHFYVKINLVSIENAISKKFYFPHFFTGYYSEFPISFILKINFFKKVIH